MAINAKTEYRPDIDWGEYCQFWTNRLVKLHNFGFIGPAKIIKVVKSQSGLPLFWVALDQFGGGTRTVIGRGGFEPFQDEAEENTENQNY